jgi:hypothetical protein
MITSPGNDLQEKYTSGPLAGGPYDINEDWKGGSIVWTYVELAVGLLRNVLSLG